MASYMKVRYHEKMEKMRGVLGNRCAICFSVDCLEIHHLDPSQKSFTLSGEVNKPWKEILLELEKCELRCENCHKKEHAADHGIATYSHQKCRCDICKSAWNEHSKLYRRNLKLKKV